MTVQFLCDRVVDASGLREAAEGLLAVQRYDRFSGDHATQMATAYVKMLDRPVLADHLSSLLEGGQELQRHPQGSRFVVLTLIDSLMAGHRERRCSLLLPFKLINLALKALAEPFVVGLTDLVAGEKDPRNLMIVFSVLKVVMVEWDISRHVEVSSACPTAQPL